MFAQTFPYLSAHNAAVCSKCSFSLCVHCSSLVNCMVSAFRVNVRMHMSLGGQSNERILGPAL
jgi:hypothetical protein